MTRGVAVLCEEKPVANLLIAACLNRHAKCDWGDVCDEDKKANDFALDNKERILSSYEITGEKIWIITEWDRSVTTVLFPSEY